MSYAKLGTNCFEQTIAFTSNTKFLSPVNPVYFQSVEISQFEQTVKEENKEENKEEKFQSSGCKSCGS